MEVFQPTNYDDVYGEAGAPDLPDQKLHELPTGDYGGADYDAGLGLVWPRLSPEMKEYLLQQERQHNIAEQRFLRGLREAARHTRFRRGPRV